MELEPLNHLLPSWSGVCWYTDKCRWDGDVHHHPKKMHKSKSLEWFPSHKKWWKKKSPVSLSEITLPRRGKTHIYPSKTHPLKLPKKMDMTFRNSEKILSFDASFSKGWKSLTFCGAVEETTGTTRIPRNPSHGDRLNDLVLEPGEKNHTDWIHTHEN